MKKTLIQNFFAGRLNCISCLRKCWMFSWNEEPNCNWSSFGCLISTNFKRFPKQEISSVYCGSQDQMGGSHRQRCEEAVFIQHDKKVPTTSRSFLEHWDEMIVVPNSVDFTSCWKLWKKQIKMAVDSEKRTPWWNQKGIREKKFL